MLLVELTHTSHTLAATGIQQVCRHLYAEMTKLGRVEAIVFDPWQRSWRTACAAEKIRLRPDGTEGVARRKGEVWKTGVKISGLARRWTGIKGPFPANAGGVLMPEFVSNRCLDALPRLRALLPETAPIAAVFHDAIALRFPEISARETVERFPRYVRELASLDAVAAVSEASKVELLGLWEKMGIADVPPVVVIPLGIEPPRTDDARPAPPFGEDSQGPRVLCVSTLEPRKNHAALLDAAEKLWTEGVKFRLELVGMAHRELGAPIVAKISEAEAKNRQIVWRGAVENAVLRSLYRACDFTIYCSLMEGFGLPVFESLAYRKPCVCTTCGALDEASTGGGCLRLEGTDACPIAEGLRRMIADKALREKLAAEAASRTIRTWADYAKDMLAFSEGIRPRSRKTDAQAQNVLPKPCPSR